MKINLRNGYLCTWVVQWLPRRDWHKKHHDFGGDQDLRILACAKTRYDFDVRRCYDFFFENSQTAFGLIRLRPQLLFLLKAKSTFKSMFLINF